MGAEAGLHAILEERPWPQRVYLTCRGDHLSLSRRHFDWDATIPMWRMVLRPQSFTPVRGRCVRLTAHHLERLQALYGLGGGGAFTLAQLETGIFCGVFVGDELVAAAGTHIVSQTYGVAAVGNVFTRQEHRKCGFGTLVTSAVVEELLAAKIPDIVLNVAQDNQGAVAIYERLGFEHYCPFFEGPASAL
jgi:GNAT superfamily N-acetyltransferase